MACLHYPRHSRSKDASTISSLGKCESKTFKKEYQFFSPKTSHVDLIEVAPLKGSLKLYMARLPHRASGITLSWYARIMKKKLK